MSAFQVGYASVNINPVLGCGIHGYYIPRFAKGFLDDLEAHGIVLAMGGTRIAMISVDLCELMKPLVDRYRAAIEKATGIQAKRWNPVPLAPPWASAAPPRAVNWQSGTSPWPKPRAAHSWMLRASERSTKSIICI